MLISIMEKNWQMTMDWYKFGFRMGVSAECERSNPQIGRFPSLDPKADEFAFVSAYNYAENRPIDCIDLWELQQYRMMGGLHPSPGISTYYDFDACNDLVQKNN